jgi:pleiotropic regulator 1
MLTATANSDPESNPNNLLAKRDFNHFSSDAKTTLSLFSGEEKKRMGALIIDKIKKVNRPTWHAPWKLKRVIAGHQGWVRSIDFDPSNQWFVTGSNDRTIKFWDTASGQLKLSLTGHINTVRGLVVSDKHTYVYSAGEDKTVRCWDLVTNKNIRNYHGHLSGVYCIALHPELNIIATGGRDATVRLWDVRTKTQIHCFHGHTDAVQSVVMQGYEPQLASGASDGTIRLWDIPSGKRLEVLTNHKKSIRSMIMHHSEYTFASASADNIKKWKCPEGTFMRNFSGHKAIVNTIALNQDNVLVSGGDNGTLYFWDWKSGYNFQQIQTIAQPGSISSEAGIFAAKFDKSGMRLVTCECDKTIKIWEEDQDADEVSHPIETGYKGWMDN